MQKTPEMRTCKNRALTALVSGWKWLKWSFTALGKGLHPTVDPDGKPLEKGSIFYKLQGTSLHPQGYRACLWAVLGDHEFFSNVLKLPHWSSHYPCWECDAQNFEGCEPTKYLKEIDLEKSNFEIASHASCLAEPRSVHPVFQLPHVSSKMVRGDPLHILFSKGLYSHLMGSILHYACWWEGPGQACVERPWKRLGLIFEGVQKEYREQGLDNRLTNLKLSMFTDASKPWASTASLHVKAFAPSIGASLGKDLCKHYERRRAKNDSCSLQFGKAGEAAGHCW